MVFCQERLGIFFTNHVSFLRSEIGTVLTRNSIPAFCPYFQFYTRYHLLPAEAAWCTTQTLFKDYWTIFPCPFVPGIHIWTPLTTYRQSAFLQPPEERRNSSPLGVPDSGCPDSGCNCCCSCCCFCCNFISFCCSLGDAGTSRQYVESTLQPSGIEGYISQLWLGCCWRRRDFWGASSNFIRTPHGSSMAFEEALGMSPKHPGPQFPRSDAPIICGSLLLHHPLRLTSNIPYEDWPLDGRSRTLRLNVCCKPNFSKPFFVTTLITNKTMKTENDKLEHSTWCWQLAAPIGIPWHLALHLLHQLASFHLPAWETGFISQRLGRTRSTVFGVKTKNDRHTQPGLMYLMYIYFLREFCKHGFATFSLKNIYISIL